MQRLPLTFICPSNYILSGSVSVCVCVRARVDERERETECACVYVFAHVCVCQCACPRSVSVCTSVYMLHEVCPCSCTCGQADSLHPHRDQQVCIVFFKGSGDRNSKLVAPKPSLVTKKMCPSRYYRVETLF